MKTWPEFYRDRILSPEYRSYCRQRYLPFLKTIVSNIKQGDRVVEVGCGLGTMTALLIDDTERSWCGFHCFDINEDMVEYARQNLYDGYPVDIMDARKPTGRLPDVIHSHGMLEHFSDDDIRAVIKAGADDGARVAIHYVPGDKYEKPSRGDERLMSIERWMDIAKPTETYKFNDDHDYTLVWRY